MKKRQLSRAAKADKASGGVLVRLGIARGLADLYQYILKEPLPYQLKSLLAKLSSAEKDRDRYDGSL